MPVPESVPELKAANKSKTPLYMRLYFQAAYYEIVRMVGYAGIPIAEARAGMQELGKRFDKEKLVEAAEALVDISAEFVRLKPDVRRLSHQLLGPAPETPSNTNAGDARGSEHVPIAGVSHQEKPVKPPQERSARRKTKTPSPPSPPPTEASKPKENATPLMDQYRAAKAKHPDMILVFRIGDFYEVFDDDAETCHKLLGLTLTTRDREIKMAGFPHHQLETYLHKLLKSGQRVAVCDQIDADAKTVRREITRVVTPGSGIESNDKPVKQPRHFVLKKYEEWLTAEGFAFVAVADVKKTTPAVAPHVGGLDFIVLRDEAKLLVTVRPHLQTKHLDAMRELQKLFGTPYQPVRFWPVEGSDGWRWQEHPIDTSQAEPF